ncbi:MAG TPA: long-chain fatty acid--CoA ligase [Polyangiaceae bacterium]|nr:long-chain fatty acid--CoA ligase [Polyangiaceae bacterium]
MPTDTVVERLFAEAARRPEGPALHEKRGGLWRTVTYRQYADLVKRFGRALLSLGFQKADTISILAFNRVEWVVSAMGAMAAGGAAAGIYTTSSASEAGYIVGHAEAKVLVLENLQQWDKMKGELESLPKLQKVVLMRGTPAPDHPLAIGWEAFLALGDAVSDERLLERAHSLEPQDLATLIYTSGTTGPPKGVMLSHGNIAFVAGAARRIAEAKPSDCSLSYLPLSHIAEQMFTVHGPVSWGGSIYFAESLEKVPEHLKEIQPTVFFGVPRIWEKFHAGIQSKLAGAKGAKKRIFTWASQVGTQVSALRCKGEEPRGLLALEYQLAKRLVFDKLKPALGLGRARFCVSGAAPIAKEILEFFASLDIIIMEVYGQSEDTGPTSFNRPGRVKFGTVGPAIDDIEVKIAEDGEILVRGPHVFLGYLKEPEATAETLKDGWLCSGDLGAFDSDGFLSITGRKKEILITAGGKNIAPKNIESALKNHPLVGEAVVIGDRRKYLTCLIALDPEGAAAYAKEKGVPVETLHQNAGVRAELQKAIDEVNLELARVETVKKFHVLPKPFGIDTGELTPTLKVKRKVVNQKYSAEIEAMYTES